MLHALVIAALVAIMDGGDQILLKDGRLLQGKVEERPDGLYLKLQNGDVRVPDDLVQETNIGDDEAYQPKNDFEREQLKKGLVLFQGTWVSKGRRETVLKQRLEKRQKRIDEIREHQSWSKAYEKKTAHFDFKSNCSKEVLEDYANKLERYYATFMKAWSIKLKPGQVKSKPLVSIYRNYASFLEQTRKPSGVLGYFDPLKEELHVYWDLQDPELSWSVLFHEGNHLLTHLIDPTFMYPNWINEGMAEYYGASRFEGDDVKTGALHPHRLVELKLDLDKGKSTPAESLIQEAAAYNANCYKSYNWGWSLVHYLLETPKYSQRMKKYFLALSVGPDVKRTTHSYSNINFQETPGPEQVRMFQKILGIADLGAFNKEWQAYAKGLTEKLDAKGWYIAARAAFRQGKLEDAEASLAKAFEQGCEEGGAHYLQGMLALLQGKLPVAIPAFAKAMEVEPLNARYVFVNGQTSSLLGRAEEGNRLQLLARELDPEGFEDWSSDVIVEVK